MLRAVDVVATGSVGIWLGSIVFFSFVVAPRIFAVLERERAGDVVNAIFPAYYVLGSLFGVVAFGAGVVRGVLDAFGLYLGLYFASLAVGVVLAVFSRAYLVPRIEGTDRSRDNGDPDAFEKYHGASVKLNSLMLVTVGAALVFWHV